MYKGRGRLSRSDVSAAPVSLSGVPEACQILHSDFCRLLTLRRTPPYVPTARIPIIISAFCRPSDPKI